MAIYEYDCPKCGTFEVKQKMSDPLLTTHEGCGQPVERRISLSSFSLKGGSSPARSSQPPPCGGGGCGAEGMCPARMVD